MLPRMIKSRTPSALFAEVMEEMRNGMDIHTPMFVSYSGELVLWMAESAPLYEYILVTADDLDELSLKVEILSGDGYDQVFHTVMFNGQYLQWMARMRSETHVSAVNLQKAVDAA